MTGKIIFDRMYGRLRFPKVIRDLLNDPGLLRLREVRMANVSLFRFPSFSSVTRYEHSLGVCHLADVASQALGLSKSERIELMIACLYHDVGTPPFAHATEEILSQHFGFSHEQNLYNLIVGKTEDIGLEKSQVFLGRGLKLHRVCQNKAMRNLDIDVFKIADIAIGKGPLGSLVMGDIDLDNIDNVFRSASAMGLELGHKFLPESLAQSFVLDEEKIILSESSLPFIRKWQKVRSKLYNHLYVDIEDFSLQTMLKHSLRILVELKGENSLTKYDWSLTDEELLYDKLRKHDATNAIFERMRLGDFYQCLSMFAVLGDRFDKDVMRNISLIENISEEILEIQCIANYFIDKRERYISRPLTFFGHKKRYLDSKQEIATIIGVFTPYKSLENRKNRRKQKSHKSIFTIPDAVASKLPKKFQVKRVKITEGSNLEILGELK